MALAAAVAVAVVPVAVGTSGAYFTGLTTSATQVGKSANFPAPGLTATRSGATTGQSTDVTLTAPTSRPWEDQSIGTASYSIKRNTVDDFSVSSGATELYRGPGLTAVDSAGSQPVTTAATKVWGLQRMDGSIALINGKPYRWGFAFEAVNKSGVPEDTRANVWKGTTGQIDFNSGVLTEMKFDSTSEELIDVAPGRDHACALSVTHKVYCIGFGGFGQVGTATTTSASSANSTTTWKSLSDPRGVFTGKSIVQITSGEYFSCALAGDGTIGCWGINTSSQLGSADVTGTSAGAPVKVANTGGAAWAAFATNKPVMIAAGADHVCAVKGLTADGVAPSKSVACWGATGTNRLGTYTTGSKTSEPQDITDTNNVFTGIKAITAGTGATCVINDKTTTNVACWGSGILTGRMTTASTTASTDSGVPTTINSAITGFSSVDMSNTHACAAAGISVVCWGVNSFQKLGNNDASGDQSKTYPPRAVNDVNKALRGEAITSVGAGWSHTCASTAYGTVACWGYNALGQLGQDTSNSASGGTQSDATYQPTTVKLNAVPLLPVRTDFLGESESESSYAFGSINGRQYVWGSGTPDGSTTTLYSTPTALNETFTTKKTVSASGYACFLTTDSRVFCWGTNVSGQRGSTVASGTTLSEIVDTDGVFAGKTIIDIAASLLTVCALTSDGTIGCWGDGGSGQLADRASSSTKPVKIGTGTNGNTPFPDLSGDNQALSIFAGWKTFCTTSKVGITCWGHDGGGGKVLGRASMTGTGGISPIPTRIDASADVFSQGARALDVGYYAACAIATKDNLTYCWGNGGNGLLGTGTNAAATATPQKVSTNAYSTLTVGDNFACAVRADTGIPECWGNNSAGQLGRTATGPALPGAVNDSNGLFTGSSVVQVQATNFAACARTDGGKLSCWGAGANGQTASGSANKAVPTAVTLGSQAIGDVLTCLDGAIKIPNGCSLVPGRPYYYQASYTVPAIPGWSSGVVSTPRS